MCTFQEVCHFAGVAAFTQARYATGITGAAFGKLKIADLALVVDIETDLTRAGALRYIIYVFHCFLYLRYAAAMRL